MARKASVRVQMAEEEVELPSFEEIMATQRPRDPGPDDEPPPVPDPAEPSSVPPEEPDETPDEEDGDEIPSPDETGTPADPPNSAALTGEIMPREVRYESRILIVDAWQYDGTLKNAPMWIDRNWAAYADEHDNLRHLEPGPALRVPTYRGDTVVCRVGDYVAQQEVKITADEPGEIKTEVWEKEQFQRLFLPVEKGAPDYIRPFGE